MNAQQLLSVSVTPVVLISACGLIATALYSRLGAILARIRGYHQQKLEVLEYRKDRLTSERNLLLLVMDSQIAQMTAKARMIQRALFCLMCAILAFLLCSLLTAVAVFHDSIGVVALAADVIGLILFASGIGWALKELVLSLSPLEEESSYLKSLADEQQNRANNQERDFIKAA